MKAINAKRVSTAINKRAKWGYEAETFGPEQWKDFDKAWHEVFRGLGTFKHGAYVSHGFGDATTVLAEGSIGFLVGTGESTRPFIQHYRGPIETTAINAFISELKGFYPNPQDEEPDF